jgi:hypothetical protein
MNEKAGAEGMKSITVYHRQVTREAVTFPENFDVVAVVEVEDLDEAYSVTQNWDDPWEGGEKVVYQHPPTSEYGHA